MRWVALLLCCTAAFALPLPDEVDSEDTRKVLGSSVVTSVSVIMDLGNGTQAVYRNNTGNPVDKPAAGGDVGSPVEMATPDQYQYYSIDGSGNVIKRFMSKDDLSSIIATNQKHNSDGKLDSPTFYHSMPANIGDLAFESTQSDEEPEALEQSQLRVHNVIASVQNLLKSQMSSQANVRPPMPTHISPEASASWSMILPSFFGNQASEEETFDEATLPSENQVDANETEPPTSTNLPEIQDREPSVSTSHKPTSGTNLVKLETIVPASSEPTIYIKNVTGSLAATNVNENVQESSESQMLGDAPALSVASDESLSSEHDKESSYATSKTEYEPVQTTESIKNTGNTKPELTKEPQSTESLESTESTEVLPELSSTKYEIISTSKVSPTLVRYQTTTKPPHKIPQASHNILGETTSVNKTSVVLHSEQNLSSPTLKNHTLDSLHGLQQAESNNTQSSSEATFAGSGSGDILDMPETNPSIDDDSTMLADAPADSIYNDDSANSDISKEKVPSEKSEFEDNSVVQSSTNSAESEEQSIENSPSSSMQNESAFTEEISHPSSEQNQPETVEGAKKDAEQNKTSSSKEQIKNSEEEKHVDSTEGDGGNLQHDASKDKDLVKPAISTEKWAITEVHTTPHSKEDVDHLRDELSSESEENENNSVEKETSVSSEEENSHEHVSHENNSVEKETSVSSEEENSHEHVSFGSTQISSEENSESTEKHDSDEDLSDSVEEEVSSSSEKPTTTSLPEEVTSSSEEPTTTTLPEEVTTPVENVGSETEIPTFNIATKSKLSETNKLDSLEELAQADTPYVDKLGEQPTSDLANTAVISEENHSSFNQVDLSTSSSKETIAFKTKNGSDSEKLKHKDANLQKNVSSTITKIGDANNIKGAGSIKISNNGTNSKLPSGSNPLSTSNEELDVSASPAETTDTSSSTPEVTEYSSSSEERKPEKVPGVSVASNEKDSEPDASEESSKTATTQTSSTSIEDGSQVTHNLDESVASIVSQITNGNIDSQITTDKSKEAISMESNDNSDVSSSVQDSGISTPNSQENASTEIVVTSVSTSKSTQSSSANVESSSKDSSIEEPSLSNVCSLDSSCLNDNVLVNSDESQLDSDRISAGSESVEISTQFVNPNKTVDGSSAQGFKNKNTIQNTKKVNSATDRPQIPDEKLTTENPLAQTPSTLLEGGVVGMLTTMLTERINTIDSATPSSTSLVENGDIIPISNESEGSYENNKINESIKLIPPQRTVKVCKNEGSGSDSLSDSCEEHSSGSGSGSGSGEILDSTEYMLFEGSGDVTTSSYASGNTGSAMNSNKENEELYDIMKYASSIKDIGITSEPKYNNSKEDKSKEQTTTSGNLSDTQKTDKLDENSASTSFVDSSEFVTKRIVPSNDKPVDGNVMDLFEYMNSDVDIGVTNAYHSSDSEATEEPSTTVPNDNETSSEELLNNDTMDLFKYVNSDVDIGITGAYTDSETETTEEPISTESNEIESTTLFDVDTMVNDQPYSDTDDEEIESIFPDHGNFINGHSTVDKAHLTTDHRKGTLPQKAQKDDSINTVKHKTQMVSPGAFKLNLEQEAQKAKRRNNTQPEDTNWTKVEVISHLANTTPTVQHTSTMKPSHETSNSNIKTSVHQSHAPVTHGARPQFHSPSSVELHPAPQESLGLEASTVHLVEDVQQFAELCNELAFKLWVSMTEKSVTASRSLVMSPFAVTSLLAMIFLGAKGSTSGQMNDMLKLDDMMTFNPHQVFRNITESVVMMQNPGVRTAAFVRELYSDKGKGPLLDFYKQRASQFYDGLVEEADFSNIGDILRRRTNLQIKKQTGGRVPEYLRGSSISLQPPLAAFSANIFQTECRGASTQGRDGEMYFTILPSTRQRRLVPIPSVVFRTGFLAGYEPGLDATVVSLGTQDSAISTLFVLPGQQGQTAPGDGLSRLETRLLATAYSNRAWSRLLRSLLARPGMEVQVPRFSHRSLLNITHSLQRMGLNELFNPVSADLKGLSGVSTALHVSDLVQINTFTTCGEEVVGSRHHVEIYPSAPERAGRDTSGDQPDLDSVPLVSRPRQARLDLSLDASGFEEAVPQAGILNMPLALRPRQARLPDGEDSLPRLKFDRPFLYFVRHNPTGFILHMGRFNPRLIQ